MGATQGRGDLNLQTPSDRDRAPNRIFADAKLNEENPYRITIED